MKLASNHQPRKGQQLKDLKMKSEILACLFGVMWGCLLAVMFAAGI
jgi:hypothetical protein